MPGVPVTIVVASGGGSVDPASGVTDAKGEITATGTLGPNAESQSLLAQSSGLPSVIVEATGILPSTIILAQGNNQTAKVGGALPNTIVVRVVGGENIPMQGVTVGFQVLAGGGAMAPQTVVTNVLGEAVTKWTLGTLPGANTALVTARALSSVPITAMATP